MSRLSYSIDLYKPFYELFRSERALARVAEVLHLFDCPQDTIVTFDWVCEEFPIERLLKLAHTLKGTVNAHFFFFFFQTGSHCRG